MRLGLFDPPTSVGFRYGLSRSSTRGFSWKSRLIQSRIVARRSTSSPLGRAAPRLNPTAPAYGLEPPSIRRLDYLPPSPLVSSPRNRCRNINLLSIAYAIRPRLRVRLTPGGLTWPGKPWVYGEQDFHLFCRYSLRHKLFLALQSSFRSTFAGFRNTPLPPTSAAAVVDPKLRCPA